MANYFDHLLSLDTLTYTVAQIAKRFELSTVLWAFHTIQPFRYSLYFVFYNILLLLIFNISSLLECLIYVIKYVLRRGVVASVVRRMNEVTLRRARLVLGWVTVFGRVYHHGM